jgi:cupin 2 domain-containing protein
MVWLRDAIWEGRSLQVLASSYYDYSASQNPVFSSEAIYSKGLLFSIKLILMPNLFELPTSLPPTELFEPLATGKGLLIQRIISSGQQTPPNTWFDQPQAEWVVLLQGEAELGYEDGTSLRLKPGDYVLIPARQRHRVEYTSIDPACIWLAVHGSLKS